MTQPPLHDRTTRDRAAERAALIAALHARPPSIAPKYLYDPLGCALFAAICELDEYYPTRTERRIFEQHRGAIAATIGPRATIIDLGAGDGAKAEAWFGALQPEGYVAVDFAASAVRATLARVQAAHPALELQGVVTDFSRELDLPEEVLRRRALFFYPGSSIGNFAPEQAERFLRQVHACCVRAPGSALLIGVDTRKDEATLTAAYDDAIGVTAAFNRNVLRNVNRLIGSDFAPATYAHRALYDSVAGRVEMHLEATQAALVRVGERTRLFEPGERILTEHSYKYAPEDFAGCLERAGFATVEWWSDEQRAFAVFCAR